MTDILEIKRRLNDRAQAVAERLLPNGIKEGNEWRVGSTGGERGKSLAVHLTGQKAGVWADFNSGEGGDLIDLWATTACVPLAVALEEIKLYLGVDSPKAFREPQKNYQRPQKPQCTAPVARVKDYLTADRNIPYGLLEKYKIGEDGDKIIFPFLLPNGEMAMAKARGAVDGASPIPTASNCEPILFGWQAIGPNERTLVITEGEIDALSMAAYGYPAMSVPFGGGGKGKQNWIENEFERLERFEKIYIATDMDPVGDEAAADISSRLGRHRCYRVKLPLKDANQCLVAGVSTEIIGECIANAQAQMPDGLRTPSSYHDEVWELFYPTNETKIGYTMPYAGVRGRVYFRPGEVTLWSGATGSGKSQVITDCIGNWIKDGSRACVASLEMKPRLTLKRLVKQTGGVDRPTDGFFGRSLKFLDNGLLIYDLVGKAGIEPLLEVFDYARAKWGCDQFVIDSLLRLGIAKDDYNSQEKAVYLMVQWAVEHDVHLHLVAHSRKTSKDYGAPGAEDIMGAMEIGANASNIITIYRNRDKEQSGEVSDMQEFTDEPGVTLNIAKQRNGDFEGQVRLYFSIRTYQYFSTVDDKRLPRCYVPDAATVVEMAEG